MCEVTVHEVHSKLSVCRADLILISKGDKATMPSAVKALHWLPSLPVTGFIYSMAGIATLTSDKGSKYMHTHSHTLTHTYIYTHTETHMPTANFQGW